MKELGFLISNTFFTMLTAIIIYYFLKFNFKLETKKNSFLFLVLSFGLVNGVIATLWTNLLEISSDLQPVKQILLLVISIIIIKLSLSVNWLKAALAFVVIILSTGVGNIMVLATTDITVEEARLSLYSNLVANIIIHITAIIVLVIVQLLIKLTRNVISKNNSKSATES